MKIRSFPIGLLILILFSVNLTSCGVQPASPTSTAPAAQTPTLATPSQTSTPPESPLPEIKKYTQDEINQMTNDEKLAVAPNLDDHNKCKASGQYVLYTDQNSNIVKAFDLTRGEYKVIPDYPITKIENFREFEIQLEDLLNGNYWLWLNTLSKPFDSEKIRFVKLDTVTDSQTVVIYDKSTAPNYENSDERPFRRNVTSAVVHYGDIDYLVAAIEYANPAFPSDASKNVWVIGIYPMGMLDGRPLPSGKEERLLDVYLNGMNIPALLVGYEFSAGEIPLTKYVWEQNGIDKMTEKFGSFISGDISALDGSIVNIITGRTINQGTIEAPDYFR